MGFACHRFPRSDKCCLLPWISQVRHSHRTLGVCVWLSINNLLYIGHAFCCVFPYCCQLNVPIKLYCFIGYGQSKAVTLNSTSKEEFLAAVVKTLDARPVIISPSMSGSFSLPYLFTDPSASSQRATAYIPVAPVGTGQFTKNYCRSLVGLHDTLLSQAFLSLIILEYEKRGTFFVYWWTIVLLAHGEEKKQVMVVTKTLNIAICPHNRWLFLENTWPSPLLLTYHHYFVWCYFSFFFVKGAIISSLFGVLSLLTVSVTIIRF